MRKLFFKLYIENCTATKLDPELKRLSEMMYTRESTQEIFAYLKSLKEWPPAAAMPEDQPSAARYMVPDDGPIQSTSDAMGKNDPEQQALQEECREKSRTLIATVHDGDNQLASLVDAAKKYRDLIDRNPQDILASALWSAANTLRARYEAHQSAKELGRINEELPPLTAEALLDLLETHGIFFTGHPGAAEIERKRREFLTGPRNPEAREVADKLATSFTNNPKVLEESAASAVASDQEAAAGKGPSAQMAETSLFDRLQNITGAIARKVWNFSKTKTGVAVDALIGAEVTSWWIAKKSLIVDFYTYLGTKVPEWLNWLVSILS